MEYKQWAIGTLGFELDLEAAHHWLVVWMIIRSAPRIHHFQHQWIWWTPFFFTNRIWVDFNCCLNNFPDFPHPSRREQRHYPGERLEYKSNILGKYSMWFLKDPRKKGLKKLGIIWSETRNFQVLKWLLESDAKILSTVFFLERWVDYILPYHRMFPLSKSHTWF